MSHDQVINNNKEYILTYIDYTVVFDSISHKFMDRTLTATGASRKSRVIFHAIYRVSTGIAIVRNVDNQYEFSYPEYWWWLTMTMWRCTADMS